MKISKIDEIFKISENISKVLKELFEDLNHF